MLKRISLIFLVLLLWSGRSIAFTECEKTPSSVWQAFDTAGNIYICFVSGDGGCIRKSLNTSNMDERKLNNFYAMGLTAVATGRTLRVRYPENGYDCTSTTTREDVQGIWLK